MSFPFQNNIRYLIKSSRVINRVEPLSHHDDSATVAAAATAGEFLLCWLIERPKFNRQTERISDY